MKYKPCFPTPGRKTWLLCSVRDMSWGLRNPCFTMFSLSQFSEMTCNNCYPNPTTIKITVYKIQD